MLQDQLYDPDEQHLPLDEAIRRIAPAFGRVQVDRARGDARIRENYDSMVARRTPELILQSQSALFGAAAWVSVADDDLPAEWLEFLLLDHVDVWVEYRSEADRERFRPVVLKIADLLGYQVAAKEGRDA